MLQKSDFFDVVLHTCVTQTRNVKNWIFTSHHGRPSLDPKNSKHFIKYLNRLFYLWIKNTISIIIFIFNIQNSIIVIVEIINMVPRGLLFNMNLCKRKEHTHYYKKCIKISSRLQCLNSTNLSIYLSKKDKLIYQNIRNLKAVKVDIVCTSNNNNLSVWFFFIERGLNFWKLSNCVISDFALWHMGISR